MDKGLMFWRFSKVDIQTIEYMQYHKKLISYVGQYSPYREVRIYRKKIIPVISYDMIYSHINQHYEIYSNHDYERYIKLTNDHLYFYIFI